MERFALAISCRHIFIYGAIALLTVIPGEWKVPVKHLEPCKSRFAEHSYPLFALLQLSEASDSLLSRRELVRTTAGAAA